MIVRTRRPTHPGKVLLNNFILARGLTIPAFAEVMKMPVSDLQKIIDGTVNIPPCIALRLSRCLNTTVHLWLNLQAAVDSYDYEQS